MPPMWSLGYHQCRWSYDSDARVRQVEYLFCYSFVFAFTCLSMIPLFAC